MKKLEIELKFPVVNPSALMTKIDGRKPEIMYIKDEVFNKGKMPKVRKRTINYSNRVEVSFERTTPIQGGVMKKVVEEKITSLPKGYVCKNSYDKIRYAYVRGDCVITIDFYCFGVFCEIEGNEKVIKEVAKRLGFKLKDNITKNVDALFCDWCKKRKIIPPLHWGFSK